MPGGLAGIIELSDIAYQYAVPGSLGYEIGLYTGAQTETKACDELAQRIHAMLTHNGPSGGSDSGAIRAKVGDLERLRPQVLPSIQSRPMSCPATH